MTAWWEPATELEATDDRTEQQCAARGHEAMIVSITREIISERVECLCDDKVKNLERSRKVSIINRLESR